MGIPQFFRFVRTACPEAVKDVHPTSTSSKTNDGICDHLFLDFNCAVHSCACSLLDRIGVPIETPSVSCENFQNMVIEESCRFVIDVVTMVRPTRSLFIAIDGIPPRSKMVQQRSRRYISQWMKDAEHERQCNTSLRKIIHKNISNNTAEHIEHGRHHHDTGTDTPASPPLSSSSGPSVTNNPLWDSNCVTPGTRFMAALAKRLKQVFLMRKKSPFGFSLYDVQISDSEEPSEGEQKIYSKIRSCKYPGRCMVYGLDADLILLSSLSLRGNEPSSHDKNNEETSYDISILRPSDEYRSSSYPPGVEHPPRQITGAKYHVINAHKFRSFVNKKMSHVHASATAATATATSSETEKKGGMGGEVQADTAMREFAFLCSLMGNDFVPGLACLPVCSESIDALISAHAQAITHVRSRSSGIPVVSTSAGRNNGRIRTDTVTYYTHDGTGIELDYEILEKLFDIMSEQEDEKMILSDARYYAQCREQMRRNVFDLERYPLSHPFPDHIRPTESGWRLRYYHHLFFGGGTDVAACACDSYIHGLKWSINYHCQTPYASRNVAYFYRYHYAPTILDLTYFLAASHPEGNNNNGYHESAINSCDMNDDNDNLPSHGIGFVPNTEMQMLMVLPGKSVLKFVHKHPSVTDIVRDPHSGCKHYYPIRFRMLTYLKRYASECFPLLPCIDYGRLSTAYFAATGTTAACGRKSKKTKTRE